MRRAVTDVRNGSTLTVLATHARRDDASIRVLVVVGFRRRHRKRGVETAVLR